MTLGSFSLFRGLAEGMTGGVDNFTHFPESFLFLGQGYLAGRDPDAIARARRGRGGVLGLAAPVDDRPRTRRHRLLAGRARGTRAFRSIAGSAWRFLLSGLASSLAAIIYVAHLGQAKADAGTGYELLAITAVVLGGTSIFGGRGSVHGTIAGPVRDRDSAKRPAARRPAGRTCRRADRRPSAGRDRSRPQADLTTTTRNSTRNIRIPQLKRVSP